MIRRLNLRFIFNLRYYTIARRKRGAEMSEASRELRTEDFLRRLTDEIDSHIRLRRWDSGLYQFLVIGSAIAGFASLSFGLIATKENNFGIWAGAIGALTSVAAILSQQLNCVKAVNWHARMAVQLDVIRAKFLDKYQSAPSDEELRCAIPPYELRLLSGDSESNRLARRASWIVMPGRLLY